MDSMVTIVGVALAFVVGWFGIKLGAGISDVKHRREREAMFRRRREAEDAVARSADDPVALLLKRGAFRQ